MNHLIQEKRPIVYQSPQHLHLVAGLMLLALLNMAGCSSYTAPSERSTAPQARMPVPLPEISRPNTRTQKTAPDKKPASAPVATVKRYSEGDADSVITQREIRTVEQKSDDPGKGTASNVLIQKPVEQRPSEPTPYDAIEKNVAASEEESSPAVKSLLLRARADMAIGNDQMAISKLERALRIEPANADLWLTLARAHHAIGEHQQSITMAKKAIGFSAQNEQLVSQSWQLIEKAGETSGDTSAVREAINYQKSNP